MKYKLLIIAVMIFAGHMACKKYNKLKDTGATGGYEDIVNGRLLLYDTFTQRAIYTPLAGKQLTVSFKSDLDSINYIISTKTDAEGYFQIKNLNPKAGQYRFWYRELMEGKLFSGVNYSAVPNEKLTITAGIAMTGQTGVIFNVTDAGGNPVSGADICVSQSPIPSNNNSCEGSSFSIKSDAYGKNAKFNLAAGTYYVLSQVTINTVVYRAKSTFTITDKVESKVLTLLPPTAAANNGYEFLVTDKAGSPINQAAICLYASRELYLRDTCEGSNYNTISNILGKAAISKIEPGKYYVIANAAFTNFQMIARDSIEVNDQVGSLQLKLERW